MLGSNFINRCINFLAVGLSLYALAGTYQYFSHDPIIKYATSGYVYLPFSLFRRV